MIDFGKIKLEAKITDVCARYGIQLRFRGEWASAKCPLPTHKDGEKDKTFQVNLPANYWKCWSESCNAKNGGKKGGDVINLVALLENCSEYDAAKKLIEWFHLETKKAGPRIENRPAEIPSNGNPKRTNSYGNGPAGGVKSGYMHETGIWLDEMLVQVVPDEVIRKTVKKAIMEKIHESYKNGKKTAFAPT